VNPLEHRPARDQATYEIWVRGHLDTHWVACFEGVTVAYEPDGRTVLRGQLDQAALHGLLARLRDLGLTLLSVSRAEEDGT
jgi:hypothetical protein